MNYNNIKKNVKILVEKYTDLKLKFNKYIDNPDFTTKETLVCSDLYNEIILLINDFKDTNDSELYSLWKRIYMKYFNFLYPA
jgi:hypothetical protein